MSSNSNSKDETLRVGPPATREKTPVPQVPDHELLRLIDVGSYGEIWLARNVMGTYRAVKILYRKNFEREHPFEREFVGIQKFEPVSRSHDGFMDILQVGRNDAAGYFYYVMELADDINSGPQIDPATYAPRTLRSELARRTRLPFTECLPLSLSLTAALGHLHQQGLVHRDIKPSNIIFVHGVPKLADIGLVADVGDAWSVVGTVGFIPPEGPGTPSGDLFSLGKVLYEICTGQDRQNYPALPKALEEASSFQELLELFEIIQKACQTDIRRRYQAADEMYADLLLLQAGKSVRHLRTVERRLTLLTRLALAALLLALFAGGSYYLVDRDLKKQAEIRQQLIGKFVADGARAMDEGDLFGSLPWFAEALSLVRGDPQKEEPHRLRLGVVLRQCPKIVRIFFEHNALNAAELSPTGLYLVTGSIDGTATVWNATNGARVALLAGHTNELESVSFSRDGRFIVTSSMDETARVWEADTGRLLRIFPHAVTVHSARFHPEGNRILTACGDGQARLWDVATGQLLFEAPHAGAVRFASFSADGRHFVTASADATAQVWDTATGQRVGPPLRHDDWVYHASFSPDGRHVATASFDRTARVWDAVTGQKLVSLGHAAAVHSAQYSPDGRSIVTACWDYTAWVWDATTGKSASPPLRHSGNVMQAAFGPEGRRILTASMDGMARLWDLSANNWLPAPTTSLYSADGNCSVTISQRTVKVLNHTTGHTRSFDISNALETVVLNEDGSRMVAFFSQTGAAGQKTLWAQLWDNQSGKPVAQPFSYSSLSTNAVLSRDGNFMVTLSGPVAQTWHTVFGFATSQPLLHRDKLSCAAFDPSGALLVTASETNAFVRETGTGQLLRVLRHANPVHHVAFSPNGFYVVAACKAAGLLASEAQIWEARTGQPVGEPLKHRDGVLHGAFSPDSQFVVTASEDRTAQVWIAATGKRAGLPLRHNDEVLDAVFSRDGRRIVTACRGGTARVWDAETSEPLTPALKHLWSTVAQAQFINQGRSILTKRFTGEACVCALPPDTRPVGDLVLLAQLLSGHEGHSTGGILPKTPEELREAWKTLRSQYPADFQVSEEEVWSWHAREVEKCLLAKQGAPALFHLEFLAKTESSDAERRLQLERLRREAEALLSRPEPSYR
ncbi:MAG: protein kinase [Chloroflexi bacterium]|nr:protein kinase [Chloroflexota bacterium]